MLWARASLQLWLLVLLFVFLIPGSSPNLAAFNPWLSACDLTRTTLRSDCPISPPLPSCMTPDGNTCQCLHYLNETKIEMVCSLEPYWLRNSLANLHLQHCYEFRVLDVMSPELMQSVVKGGQDCVKLLNQLRAVDDTAADISCDFADVLRRFDCQQPYTAKFNCTHCKVRAILILKTITVKYEPSQV